MAAEVKLARLGDVLANHFLMGLLLLSAAGLPTMLSAPIPVASTLTFVVYASWSVGCYVLLSRDLKWPIVGYAASVVLASLSLIPLSGLAGSLGDAVESESHFGPELLLCLALGCWTVVVVTQALNAAKIARTGWGTAGYFALLCGWPFFLFALRDRLKTGFAEASRARTIHA